MCRLNVPRETLPDTPDFVPRGTFISAVIFASTNIDIVLFAVAQSFNGVFGNGKAIIFAEFRDIVVYYLVAGDCRRCFIYGVIVLKILVIVGNVVDVGIFFEYRSTDVFSTVFLSRLRI